MNGESNGIEAGSSLGESGRPIVEPSDEETSTSGHHHTHFLCVSPDAPTNPVLYWMGNFDSKSTRFLLEGAKGPLRLDLGDILYAPNLMVDEKVWLSKFKDSMCCSHPFFHAKASYKVHLSTFHLVQRTLHAYLIFYQASLPEAWNSTELSANSQPKN